MGCSSSHVPEPEEPPPTRIETVVIQLDDASDEFLVPRVGTDYPPAEPPMSSDFKPPVKWYDDDDDEYKPEEDIFGSQASLLDTERRLAGEGSNVGSLLRKVDEHAKRATKRHGESFESLIMYLTSAISDQEGTYRQLLTIRALVAWLSAQDIEKKQHGPASHKTPNGYLQLQKEKRATFASIFATLCRKSGIKCTLIKGICKGGSYQPGDSVENTQESMWVAVNVQNSWQLLHPFWVCRSMVGQKTGGWIKLEEGGKTVSKSEEANQGRVLTAFKETYFMPRPDDFKYVCYPDEDQWQLLPENRRVKSREDFLKLPFLLPAFFGLGLNLLSSHSCEVEAMNGIATIALSCRRSQAFKTVMTYDLFIKETVTSDNVMLQEGNLPRLVLNSRVEEKFAFQIRCPVEGTYKIVFYAGVYGQPLMRVCEFKLNCAKRLANCQLLPINTGIEGWGPGPASERAGLLMASHMGGLIQLQAPPEQPAKKGKQDDSESTVNVKFVLDQAKMKTTEFSAIMMGSSGIEEARELSKNVKYEVNQTTKELDVQATVPKAGEFALMILARKTGKKKRSVCNYLLSTLHAIREGVPQRKARRALQAAIAHETNLEELTAVIEKCRKVKIDDNDDDVRAAKRRLTYLGVKKHLEDCHKRRNLDVTQRTLKEVSKYRHKLALIIETHRVDRLKRQLEKLGGFTREVPQLNKACEELMYQNNAKPEVMSTMTALFMLLDEPVDRLNDWGNMQGLLKVSREHNNNVLNRMKSITERPIDAKLRRKISSILHTYTDTQVRHASQAAASFYQWVDGVLVALGEQNTEMSLTNQTEKEE